VEEKLKNNGNIDMKRGNNGMMEYWIKGYISNIPSSQSHDSSGLEARLAKSDTGSTINLVRLCDAMLEAIEGWPNSQSMCLERMPMPIGGEICRSY
jgi:hypothetical protein